MHHLRLVAAASLLALALPAAAQEPAPAVEKEVEFELKTGSIVLGKDLAKVELPAGLGYLDPRQTQVLLEELWGNPDGSGTLGMILPIGVDPDDEEGWGVVLNYLDDGHVDDEDAAEIDYAKLMKQMQDDTREENEARVEAGFEPVEVVGWATAPYYDAANHKLHWAKELRFGDAESTLNYDIRVLGNEGVLSMNAVASMDQLSLIQGKMQALLPNVAFLPGNRYDDFDPKTGRMAAYGVAGLVAGKAAAKAGLFKGLIAILLASKKLLVVGVVAFGAGLARLFGRKKG